MATDSPLDLSIKSNCVCDTWNLIGIKRFDRKKESINKIKHRMKGLNGKGKKSGIGKGIRVQVFSLTTLEYPAKMNNF